MPLVAVQSEAGKRVTLKAYTTPTILPGDPVDIAVDPIGTTGGQVLRRVSSVMNPQIAEFISNELNTAKQVKSVRHGAQGVTGTIGGELSPGTYTIPFHAVMRCSQTSVTNSTQANFTSLTASSTASSFTVGSGMWTAEGYTVGDTFRPGGITGPNLGMNFTIAGLAAGVATVFPPPADMAADTSFTLTVPGRKFIMPDPPLRQKYLIEHYDATSDLGELAVECKFTSMKVTMDDKVSTVEFGYMGRQYMTIADPTAPYFLAPLAPFNSEVCTTFGGFMLFNGVVVAVVTKAEFTINLNASKQDIAFVKWTPEIFTGKMTVTGTFDAFVLDNNYKNKALQEGNVELLFQITTKDDPAADFITFHFSLCKLGAFTSTGSGDAGVTVTFPFTAYQDPRTTAAGYNNTTVVIRDSLADNS